jgi:thiol:disulfide interchange protein DsbD
MLGLLTGALIAPVGQEALAATDFLPIEEAFQPSAEALSADQLAVRWQIAPGYYLYQSKFRLRSDTEGITLGQPELPPGEVRQDQFFG